MIACKTETGQRVMRDRSIALSPRQRSALILFDGKRSVGDVLAATGAAGVTREDVQRLFELNLISRSPEPGRGPGSAPSPLTDAAQAALATRSSGSCRRIRSRPNWSRASGWPACA